MMDSAPCTPLSDEDSPLTAHLDAVTDGVLIVDRSWCITWTNSVAEALLGESSSPPAAGQDLWTAFPELKDAPFGLAWRRAMLTGAAISVESLFPSRDAWFEARAFPSRYGLMITFRDVSERFRENEARQRMLSAESRARQEAEHAAERIAVLQELTAELSSALTPEQVVDVVVGAAMVAVGADAASVALPKDAALHLVAFRGLKRSVTDRYATIDPQSDLPICRAYRGRASEWLGSVGDFLEKYPHLEAESRKNEFTGALACLPLTVGNQSLGAACLNFNESRSFPREERVFLEAIAHQCALALDRAQIFAREHEARARAEADEQRFRAIMQSPMMGLILTDFDGRVLEANDAFLRMLGFSRADLHRGALDWRALTPPEFAPGTERALAEMRGRGYAAPFEKAYYRKDGSQLPVLVASTRIEEQNVNATFVLDVSERNRMLKEATASARRSGFLAEASRILGGSLDYRATLQSIAGLAVPALADWCAVDMLMADGSLERLAVKHPDPRKLELASELARRFPVDLQASHGVAAVLRTGEPDWVQMIPDALLEKVARSPEHLELIRELGLRSYICVPIKARGVVLGAITMVYAESSRLYDDADFHLAQELARQASMAVDNARLYAEAREAVRLRDEFLSVASHELKTPLTPLQLRLQGMVREARGTHSEKMAQHVDVAQRQVRKLASLVDGLLDVSRISAGKLMMEIEEVDLAGLAKEVVRGHEQEAARVGSLLELDSGSPVVGSWDRLRIEQVVTNLVSNAIKYGAGRPIQVRVVQDGANGVVEVHDEGIGVPVDDQVRIFERFERAVSGRNYGGLGLGLYITRRIVEAHGGSIQVTSVPGDGSTFRVALPLSVPPTGAAG